MIVNKKKLETGYIKERVSHHKLQVFVVSENDSAWYLSQFIKIRKHRKNHAVQVRLTRKTLPLFYGFAYIEVKN